MQPDLDDDSDPYPPLDSIEWSQIDRMFRSLVIFDDDIFLAMQGTNIALADGSLSHWERDLHREWIETEKTPSFMAMNVGAWSQMWVFGLYEVLRTWRQRIEVLVSHQKKGALDDYIRKYAMNEFHAAAQARVSQAQAMQKDPSLMKLMLEHRAKLQDVWKMTEAFRINLAKHEMPNRDSSVPRLPGYGRINPLCGALDYEIFDRNSRSGFVNRRDLAEALRRVNV